jgi:hypothetical protein
MLRLMFDVEIVFSEIFSIFIGFGFDPIEHFYRLDIFYFYILEFLIYIAVINIDYTR